MRKQLVGHHLHLLCRNTSILDFRCRPTTNGFALPPIVRLAVVVGDGTGCIQCRPTLNSLDAECLHIHATITIH